MQEFPRNIHVFIFINNLLPVSIATGFFQISILKFCMCCIVNTETVPATPVDDQQVEVDESVDTTSHQLDTEQETSVIPLTSQGILSSPSILFVFNDLYHLVSEVSEVSTQDKTIVEEKPADISLHSDPGREALEETPLIVPKKGYDLSFLDKLEDLENASPVATVVKGKSIVDLFVY
jgi:hypothetical protein